MTNSNESLITAYEYQKAAVERTPLHYTLSAVAHELLRFHTTPVNSFQSVTVNDDPREKVCLLQSSLKLKKKRIKKLKEDVKLACLIARTAICTNENETNSLTKYLSKAKSEATILLEKSRRRDDLIKNLHLENKILTEDLAALYKFIDLGYKELIKLRDEKYENLPTAKQLSKILMCCGQYYADFCNEQEKYIALEQKNRFLQNRISILENSLFGITEELRNLKYLNIKLKKENDHYRTAHMIDNKPDCVKVINSKSENNIKYLTKKFRKNMSTEHNKRQNNTLLDLSEHISLVRNILCDQDNLLIDLRNIQTEILNMQ